jgi:hypothetical protein
MYRDHLRTYFNSILLHRILIANNNDMDDPTAVAVAQTCYATSFSLLQQSVRLGNMYILYYQSDVTSLMTANAAMVLLKIIKLAPHCPGVSVEAAYEILKSVAQVHTNAAGTLRLDELLPGNVTHKTPVDNSVEGQARLMRAILLRIRVDLLPHYQDPYRAQLSPMPVPTAGEYGPQMNEHDFAQGQMPPQDLLPGMPTELHPGATDEQSAMGASLYSGFDDLGAGHLAEDMGFSLETSFIDSRFMDAGLVTWDEPGMFRNPK